jgi:hypothetical protein
MLSVDNYVHGGTQGFNRYSYALNNPLRYSDPNGEEPILMIAAAVVGGVLNTIDHLPQIAKNPWSAIGYFGAGALGGAAAVISPAAGFAITASLNITTDVVSGNVPKLNTWQDQAIYAGTNILSGLNAVGAPALAEQGLKLLAKSGVSWAATYGRTVTTEVVGFSDDMVEELLELGVDVTKGNVTKGAIQFVSTATSSVSSASNGSFIYRAVSKAELDDIAEFGFRTHQGGYETSKLFAPTFQEAAQFGKGNFRFDGIPNYIMKVRVPSNVLDDSYKFTADGMNAISIQADKLQLLRGTLINFSPW